MSEAYASIPPEQELQYLTAAHEAVTAATEPVLTELGGLAVGEAEGYTRTSAARVEAVASDAELHANNVHALFKREVDQMTQSVADGADEYLRRRDIFLGNKEQFLADIKENKGHYKMAPME